MGLLPVFVSAIVWAAWAELDEVTVGQGKVIPSRQLQVIQNLEGDRQGDLRQGGDIVEKGQPLLRIDDTRFKSDFREREQELVTLKGISPACAPKFAAWWSRTSPIWAGVNR